MINRANYLLSQKYLEYRKNVDLISDGSLKVERTYIYKLLDWADNVSFAKIEGRRPAFPEYLLTFRSERREGALSATYTKKTLATARRFFTWLNETQKGYRNIRPSWIKTLKVKRMVEKPKLKEVVSLDEILTIAKTPVETLIEKRTRAAACFLFLSAQRINAFISTPILAINIKDNWVKQHPSLGVKTKNRKHATTYLLGIPELLKVVSEWDGFIRNSLPGHGFWFTPFDHHTGEIDTTCFEIGEHRHTLARKNLKSWLEKNNLTYKSPHAFRYGHIHWSVERARDMADLKAISQNVMHSSRKITDEIYSQLTENSVKSRIQGLGNPQNNLSDEKDLLIQKLIKLLENQ